MHVTEIVENFLEKAKESDKPPLVVICGPTASGKTAFGINLAIRYNGEIVSADSRQIYKYMDIGTDKVSIEEQRRVPHHLIDVRNPDENYTLADYKREAEITIDSIINRGKIPFLVGGTGLYINAITDNYQMNSVPPDPKIRAELEDELERKGGEHLHKMLQELDPVAASKIHPNNHRYLIRALEINLSTNRNKEDKTAEPKYAILKLAIEWDRDLLYSRINRRVEEQVGRGILNELKTLLNQGYNRDLPSMTGLGYKEFFPYIDGQMTLGEATEQLKQNTRNYAKRQLTWFRRDPEINWLTVEDLS